MIPHHNSSNSTDWLLVAVPADSRQFIVKLVDKYWHLGYNLPDNGGFRVSEGFAFFYKDFGGKAKYPVNLKCLGKADELTEEQAAEIVEQWDNGRYRDYVRFLARHNEAIDAFLSLLDKHNLTPSNTIILKKLPALH